MASWHETHKNPNKAAGYLALGAIVVGGLSAVTYLGGKREHHPKPTIVHIHEGAAGANTQHIEGASSDTVITVEK